MLFMDATDGDVVVLLSTEKGTETSAGPGSGV